MFWLSVPTKMWLPTHCMFRWHKHLRCCHIWYLLNASSQSHEANDKFVGVGLLPERWQKLSAGLSSALKLSTSWGTLKSILTCLLRKCSNNLFVKEIKQTSTHKKNYECMFEHLLSPSLGVLLQFIYSVQICITLEFTSYKTSVNKYWHANCPRYTWWTESPACKTSPWQHRDC